MGGGPRPPYPPTPKEIPESPQERPQTHVDDVSTHVDARPRTSTRVPAPKAQMLSIHTCTLPSRPLNWGRFTSSPRITRAPSGSGANSRPAAAAEARRNVSPNTLRKTSNLLLHVASQLAIAS